MSMEAFFKLHSGLEREGPGDAASLQWAFGLAGTGPDARILDAGCGPGADSGTLLNLASQGEVIAMDVHDHFVERVAQAHADTSRLKAIRGDMLTPPGSFDLIWSAAAIYGVGAGKALTAWKKHLNPGGRVAFSDCVWRGPGADPDVRAFWRVEYPAMCDEGELREIIEAAGYQVLGTRWLGQKAWQAYYGPLEARMQMFEGHADMAPVLQETAREIDIWRRFGDQYGYLLVVAEPRKRSWV